MKHLKLNRIILLVFVITLCFSCASEEEECPDTNLPYLRLNMEQTSSFSIDTFLIYHEDLANNLYEGTAAPDCVMVPLNLNIDSTGLKFKFTIIADSVKRFTDTSFFPYTHLFVDSVLEITDVVSFIHSREVKLNDLECGFINEFDLNAIYYTNHFMDSIYLLDTLINSVEKDHVKIFY